MSHTIDSLNRAGAAARIAELEREVARRRAIISEACEMGLELGRRLELRDAEVARLRALVALGVEAATTAERRGWDRYEYPACPVCMSFAPEDSEPIPHTEDCTLARFLRESWEVGCE